MVKKILITGGCGFIGHHVVEHFLKNTDFEIVILDGLNYAGNLNRFKDMPVFQENPSRTNFIWHDLKSPITEGVAKMIGQVDYILHLAAETHVERSLKDPIPFVYSNVLGTANLLEFSRHYQKNLEKYIQISTDEVYGPAPKNTSFKEWDRVKPTNPYAATKAGADCLAFSYVNSFKMPIIITRTMNNFGERQHPEKFIPKTINHLSKKEKIEIHGTPTNIGSRFWLHARNHADALLFILTKGKNGEIYNIVGEKELNNLEIAQRISKIIRGRELDIEKEVKFIPFEKVRPGHDKRYALDGSKMSKLGWKPSVDFESSFEKTVKWIADHPLWLKI